jgi:excisionase family DNA binding protein
VPEIADPLLTTEDLAAYVKVPVATTYQWNYRKSGPAAIRVGRHLRYRKSDVDAWLVANTATTAA